MILATFPILATRRKKIKNQNQNKSQASRQGPGEVLWRDRPPAPGGRHGEGEGRQRAVAQRRRLLPGDGLVLPLQVEGGDEVGKVLL